jgi:TetR/AcrR family transcriptional repressor of mexJK operon
MVNIDRKEGPPASKAESILAAAKRSFLAAGFGAVSMDAIAREAGVSKATVYAHFAGKEELFGARWSDENANATSRASRRASSTPAMSALH